MRPRYRDAVLVSSSIVLVALAFRVALVALELRMFQDIGKEVTVDIQRSAWHVGNETRAKRSAATNRQSDRVADSHRSGRTKSSGGTPQMSAETTNQQFALTMLNAPECTSIRPDDVTLTLVTQCDDERVPLVAQLCARWNGPLAVAVFTTRSKEVIAQNLVDLACRREQLLLTVMEPSKTLSAPSYPVNHLRNLAVEQVTTTHMVVMDVDFFPSDALESIIQNETIRTLLADDYRHALVIPAFEYLPKCQNNCSSNAELLSRMPRSKSDLMRLYDTGESAVFHDYWPPAHDTTDYLTWMQQAYGSLVPIPCIKSNHYEPYLIVRKCQALPLFQEAFTGYGFNKASFTMHLQAAQYRFSQVGGVFCTHFPHPESKAKQAYNRNKHRRSGHRLQMERLVEHYASWLNGTYWPSQPVVPYCAGLS